MKGKVDMGILITNIQRMCFHDGPGIRTTVFLKGCKIHCPWCANPENISFLPQYGYERAKCKKDGENCIYNENCVMLTETEGLDLSKISLENQCPVQAVRQWGREYTADELVYELKRDTDFWSMGGGVTFSGGEPLMQASGLLPVWQSLKTQNIHMVMETCLFAPADSLKMAMEYIDSFYVDVKLLDRENCRQVLGGNIEEYLKNVEQLAAKKKDMHFRIPCSEEYVLQEENQKLVRCFLKSYSQYPVQIFGIHDLGRSKYKSLGMEMKCHQTVPKEHLEKLKEILEEEGIQVEIIKI